MATIYAAGYLIGAGVWLASLLAPPRRATSCGLAALIIEIVTPILAARSLSG